MNVVSLMHDLLSQVTAETCRYLLRVLPSLRPDWWEAFVAPVLRRSHACGSVNSLERLDLPALLRVLLESWWLIHSSEHFPQEELNYIREMTVVRNRWAHYGTVPPDTDLAYRDVDIILRFCGAIRASEDLIVRTKGVRQDLIRAFATGNNGSRILSTVANHHATQAKSTKAKVSTAASSGRTLNEAMAMILHEAGKQGLSVGDIYRRVVARNLYRQKDGAPVRRQQVQHRATHCPLSSLTVRSRLW